MDIRKNPHRAAPRGVSRRAGRRTGRLDPVRWSPHRRGRLLRAGAVTLLLLLAGGLLLTGTDPAAADHCVASRSPDPAPTGGRAGDPAIPAGKVGVPVRISQPGIGGLVHPGDHVDLTVTAPKSTRAEFLVRDVLVLHRASGTPGDVQGESMIYLAMSEQEARRVAGTGPDSRIGITVRPG